MCMHHNVLYYVLCSNDYFPLTEHNFELKRDFTQALTVCLHSNYCCLFSVGFIQVRHISFHHHGANTGLLNWSASWHHAKWAAAAGHGRYWCTVRAASRTHGAAGYWQEAGWGRGGIAVRTDWGGGGWSWKEARGTCTSRGWW